MEAHSLLKKAGFVCLAELELIKPAVAMRVKTFRTYLSFFSLYILSS